MSEATRETAPERDAGHEDRNTPETDAGVIDRASALRASPHIAGGANVETPTRSRPAIARRALALQRTRGNAYVQRQLRGAQLLRRRPPTETIEFGDDEGSTVTSETFDLGAAGRRPYDIIQDHVSQVNTALNNMREGELGAIEQFLTRMAFSSSTDAQPDVLGAVFKNVSSQLWGAAVGRLPGGAGVAVSAITGVAGAMSDELERAAAAQHSFELASFMTALRTDTLNVYQLRTTALETSTRDDLGRQFSALAGSWEPGQTRVVGDKAQFLRELRRRGAALLRAVPRPIAYQAALTRRWITDRRAGGAGLSSEDFLTRVGNGRIRLKFNTTVSGGSYSYAFVSAKLFTSTHSGQAADMVNDLMTRQHKHVYELGIPVDVLLRTENVVGGRSYFRFGIRSASDYDRTHWHPPARRAWSQMSWDPIDRITRISGG